MLAKSNISREERAGQCVSVMGRKGGVQIWSMKPSENCLADVYTGCHEKEDSRTVKEKKVKRKEKPITGERGTHI